MQFGICTVATAPIRKEPSHRSEMTSQLLFGECFEYLEEVDQYWVKIRCQHDGYEGYLSVRQGAPVTEEVYKEPYCDYTADWLSEVEVNGYQMQVPMGSALKHIRSGRAVWGKTQVLFKGNLWDVEKVQADSKLIKKIAYKYFNTAYLWGGRSVFGIDCSGFTQSVFKFLNIKLPRDASQQALEGEEVGFLSNANCGDLAFFDENDRIMHVGIILNEREIIHSAGKVRVDKIDAEGIVNNETGNRTHHLRMIKRFI